MVSTNQTHKNYTGTKLGIVEQKNKILFKKNLTIQPRDRIHSRQKLLTIFLALFLEWVGLAEWLERFVADRCGLDENTARIGLLCGIVEILTGNR